MRLFLILTGIVAVLVGGWSAVTMVWRHDGWNDTRWFLAWVVTIAGLLLTVGARSLPTRMSHK